MEVTRHRRSIAFFIALGVASISVLLVLYIGWILLNWRTGLLLVLGVLLVLMIICGIVLNTVFLVREIRRNEQHDAFINAVTHELKTPVASIRLYLQTLQTRPVDEEKRKQFYSTMLADADRLLSTIEQVLHTGRLGAAGRSLNVARVDLDELVRSCVERVRTLHGVPEESLRYVPGGPASVVADAEDVRAAVTNLIDNAVKYSGSDVRVTVQTERAGDRFVTIRVRDQGPGIPKSELKRVFRRFYRVPGPLGLRIKGTGLGLYIVRSVARRHGGRAWAESDGPGQGSTFALELPIAP
ncbi:MAG TPA: HAMP domain-containing sensor histidine kinase [Candidatus Acidoferrales bacterium]|nr:HAMP domain-containing sensor histidine kinase [Candidatus Acidoferrales bacterium]